MSDINYVGLVNENLQVLANQKIPFFLKDYPVVIRPGEDGFQEVTFTVQYGPTEEISQFYSATARRKQIAKQAAYKQIWEAYFSF